jgi:hypothetical protein
MALSPTITAFVQRAVRLPSDRLKKIDRDWERLSPHRLVMVKLIQSNDELRRQAGELREYVLAEARRVAAERSSEELIPEDIAEAVHPAARALLLRGILENSADPGTATAFFVLAEPFADILP